MDLRTILKQGITFGPFQTDHHRQSVTPEFEEAVLRHIADKIVPDLTIMTESVEGSVEASRKRTFQFRGLFRQGKRRESVDFKVEVEPGAQGGRLVFGEHRIVTARSFERLDEENEAARRELDRQADAVLKPGLSPAEHWEACARIWTASPRVLGEILGPRGVRPLPHHLCDRFAAIHPDSDSFLIEKLKDPIPLLAAYAFKCWIRLAGAARSRIPPEVLSRTEPIEIHGGCFIWHDPLGKWMADCWDDERG